jgi:hypothetical protein
MLKQIVCTIVAQVTSHFLQKNLKNNDELLRQRNLSIKMKKKKI